MSLPKPLKDLRVAILVPCYKRPEYTLRCIRSLEAMELPCEVLFHLVDDCSEDATEAILDASHLPNKFVIINEENQGLRSIITSFFHNIKDVPDIDFIAKMDNDCEVPADYLTMMLRMFDSTDSDILSPNVMPSNASYRYGKPDASNPDIRPSKTVGGLWMMKRAMIDGIEFNHHDVVGIKGAFNILYQIAIEKEAKVAWLTNVTVQDIGHWSGMHPENIKSAEHLEYYKEIGRAVPWGR